MMRFDLQHLHHVALKAFDEMEEIAFRASSDTTEFNERQFVFHIGAVLNRGTITRGAPLWTGFEYRYPGTQTARRPDRMRYCHLGAAEYRGGGDGVDRGKEHRAQ